MPWCPKCKNEYKQGIIHCADCNTALVDKLEEISDYTILVGLEKEDLAEKLTKFLKNENIESMMEYSKEEDGYIISVQETDYKKAKKLFEAFYSVETENSIRDVFKNATKQLKQTQQYNEEEVDNPENIDEDLDPYSIEDENQTEEELTARMSKAAHLPYEPATTYVKKSDKSKDLKSSAITFLLFGVLGLIFLILNIVGVFSFFDNLLSYIVMGIVFIGCLYIGFTSYRDSKTAERDAVLEDEFNQKINEWLAKKINKETLDQFEDPDSSDEINFLSKIDGIKNLLIQEFGEINDSFLDSVVEEFYNSKFEKEL